MECKVLFCYDFDFFLLLDEMIVGIVGVIMLMSISSSMVLVFVENMLVMFCSSSFFGWKIMFFSMMVMNSM